MKQKSYFNLQDLHRIPNVTSRKLQKMTDSIIDQVLVVLMVSADACTQVIQGSNPTDCWKVIRSATAFSAVAFKMILRAPVRVPVLFSYKKFSSLTAFRRNKYTVQTLNVSFIKFPYLFPVQHLPQKKSPQPFMTFLFQQLCQRSSCWLHICKKIIICTY